MAEAAVRHNTRVRDESWRLGARLIGQAPAGMRDLLKELPPRTLAPLGLAIFLLFSTMGFLVDIMDGGSHPAPLLVSNVLFSGSIALVYASSVYSWRFLAGGILVHFIYGAVIGRFVETDGPPSEARLVVDALGVIIAMGASYACFLTFIHNTGARYLRDRTEIQLAREIHGVLVPVVASRIGDYEFYGFSQASGEVGGDLVDVVPLPREGQGWIGYIADVSGHGVSSGVLMGMVKSAAHMKLRGASGGPVIAPMLNDLNAVLQPLKQSSMFVTVAAVAQAGGDTLEFSVAGHLPILQVTAGGGVREVTIAQIPVGMFEDYRFTSAPLAVASGDLLALVTDGLTEVFDAQDDEFGLDRVKAYLAQHRQDPLDRLAAGLIASVRAHGGQMDDQTILLVRRA
jgi:serine phosphatase RsbU (regulator of sigma subunit)